MEKKNGLASLISKIIITMAIIGALIVAIYVIYPNIKKSLLNHDAPAISEESNPDSETDIGSDQSSVSNNSINE